MKSNNIKVKGSKNKYLKSFNKVDFCQVSKASAEIMLERFYNGKKVDFPFSQWLGVFSYQNLFRIWIKVRLLVTVFNFINNKKCWYYKN